MLIRPYYVQNVKCRHPLRHLLDSLVCRRDALLKAYHLPTLDRNHTSMSCGTIKCQQVAFGKSIGHGKRVRPLRLQAWKDLSWLELLGGAAGRHSLSALRQCFVDIINIVVFSVILKCLQIPTYSCWSPPKRVATLWLAKRCKQGIQSSPCRSNLLLLCQK